MLTSLCKTKHGWSTGCIPNQILFLNNMISYESKVPLWFGYQRKDNSLVLPFVHFPRLRGEAVDAFLENNPTISGSYGTSSNQEGKKQFDIIFDLAEISQKCTDDP